MHPYLPVDEMNVGKYPDKKWFWSMAFTLIPNWAKAYHKRVQDQRAFVEKPNPYDDKKLIKISDKWMGKLLEFDFKSKGK